MKKVSLLFSLIAVLFVTVAAQEVPQVKVDNSTNYVPLSVSLQPDLVFGYSTDGSGLFKVIPSKVVMKVNNEQRRVEFWSEFSVGLFKLVDSKSVQVKEVVLTFRTSSDLQHFISLYKRANIK